jgi:hypothetical protein
VLALQVNYSFIFFVLLTQFHTKFEILWDFGIIPFELSSFISRGCNRVPTVLKSYKSVTHRITNFKIQFSVCDTKTSLIFHLLQIKNKIGTLNDFFKKVKIFEKILKSRKLVFDNFNRTCVTFHIDSFSEKSTANFRNFKICRFHSHENEALKPS